MKVIIITQYFYPEAFRVNDLAKGLKDRGHTVAVLTGQPNYPSGKVYPGYGWLRSWHDDFHGIPVYRVPVIARGRAGRVRLSLNYLSFVFSALLLGLPRLRRQQFDCCLVFATSPVTAAIPANFYRKFTGCPVAIWIQDLWPDVVTSVSMVRSRKVLGLIGHMVTWIYRHADLLLIQSESFRESVLKWGGTESQIRYLPNWAEDFYVPRTQAASASPFRILFAGNLGRAQALDTILKAIVITHQHGASIEWHFMGDGVLKSWLQEQVEQQGISQCVKFFPRQNETQMSETFAQYSVLLATLAKDPVLSLVLPSKIQSAMACAMPILGSDNGEMARVIEEAVCGLISPAGDAEHLARHAIQLSQMSPARLQQLGSSGRAYYQKHFERNMLIQNTCAFFQEISERRSS